jgi:uncharacterized protein (TIGR02266 family)
MIAKDHLKKIISERLGETASTIFINRTLEVINEAAENKESLLSAADRVSKRIALFIDEDLSKKVFDVLKAEIAKISSPTGTRRRYARVVLSNKVYVTYDGKTQELYTGNLSEGGMYIKTATPFPVGAKVDIRLLLETVGDVHMKGVVMNIQRPLDHPAGMGIAFKEIRNDAQGILKNFIKKALTIS